MKIQDYVNLSDAVRSGNATWTTKALSIPGLDLTYNNNGLFNSAIDEGNVEIVKMLIDYFLANHPNNYQDHNIPTELVLKKQLHDILEVAAEDIDLSDEMKKLIAPYTTNPEDSSSDSHQEITDYPDIEEIDYHSSKTSSSLNESAIELYNKDLGAIEFETVLRAWINQTEIQETSLLGNDDNF